MRSVRWPPGPAAGRETACQAGSNNSSGARGRGGRSIAGNPAPVVVRECLADRIPKGDRGQVSRRGVQRIMKYQGRMVRVRQTAGDADQAVRIVPVGEGY